jgi:hypothetical protein
MYRPSAPFEAELDQYESPTKKSEAVKEPLLPKSS